tara:strand:+ start:5526 stop:5861 length:336 start_codon:yes stop_codon:yes gene_type:complete
MAKFISMEVVANANDWENGQQLINVEQITGVQQSADETVDIYLAGGTPGDKVTLTLTTDPTGIANPVMTSNLGANAINRALTANPGGVKATVRWGEDDNGAQMYVRNVAFA